MEVIYNFYVSTKRLLVLKTDTKLIGETLDKPQTMILALIVLFIDSLLKENLWAWIFTDIDSTSYL